MASLPFTLYTTRIDLPESVRCPMVELLNQTLADTLDLKSQTKFAHWNIKGQEFYVLHQLFDQIAIEIEESADLVAERITALGGIALGTVRTAAATSCLPEYSLIPVNSSKHLELLADRFAIYAQAIRHGIMEAMGWGDAGTSDLYTQISRAIDKQLWLLEAHIQTNELTPC